MAMKPHPASLVIRPTAMVAMLYYGVWSLALIYFMCTASAWEFVLTGERAISTWSYRVFSTVHAALAIAFVIDWFHCTEDHPSLWKAHRAALLLAAPILLMLQLTFAGWHSVGPMGTLRFRMDFNASAELGLIPVSRSNLDESRFAHEAVEALRRRLDPLETLDPEIRIVEDEIHARIPEHLIMWPELMVMPARHIGLHSWAGDALLEEETTYDAEQERARSWVLANDSTSIEGYNRLPYAEGGPWRDGSRSVRVFSYSGWHRTSDDLAQDLELFVVDESDWQLEPDDIIAMQGLQVPNGYATLRLTLTPEAMSAAESFIAKRRGKWLHWITHDRVQSYSWQRYESATEALTLRDLVGSEAWYLAGMLRDPQLPLVLVPIDGDPANSDRSMSAHPLFNTMALVGWVAIAAMVMGFARSILVRSKEDHSMRALKSFGWLGVCSFLPSLALLYLGSAEMGNSGIRSFGLPFVWFWTFGGMIASLFLRPSDSLFYVTTILQGLVLMFLSVRWWNDHRKPWESTRVLVLGLFVLLNSVIGAFMLLRELRGGG